MSPSQNSIKVQFPSKPELNPASVVAIGPWSPGDQIAKGDYVLSVETPSGSRNIVASADGYLYVYVSLLDDLTPGQLLFEIYRTAPETEPDSIFVIPRGLEPAEQHSAAAASSSSPSESGSTSTGSGTDVAESILFLTALIGGVVVAGAAFLHLGDDYSVERLAGAAAILGGFLAVLWLLTRLLIGGSYSYSDTPAGLASVVMFLAVSAGLIWDGVRDFEEGSYQVVAAFLPDTGGIPGLSAIFGNGDSGPPGTIVYDPSEPEVLPPVPANTIIMDDLG